jgi:hypothetical protein
MLTSVSRIMIAAAAAGIALVPVTASAAPLNSAVLAYSSSTPSGGDPDTTVTFSVTTGVLSLSAPTTADLGSGAPGNTITGAVGTTTVSDDRAALNAVWTATASATDWTTGGGTTAETIPATDVGYDPGTITPTGTVTVTGIPITLAGTPAPVVGGTGVIGDNTATWNPTLSVAVPANAVSGTYTGVLTQSVA